VSYAQHDQAQRIRERVEAPRRWAAENVEVLHMIWEKFDATGEWPQASELQRELFRAGRRFSATEFGRQMPGALGHLDVSKGTIILTPLALSYLHAPRLVLDRMAQLARILVERYAADGVEPEVNSEEFHELLGIDEQQTRQLATLLMNDRFLFLPAGGRLEDSTQKFRADEDSVIELANVQSIDDYFEVQNRIWYSAPRAGEIPQEPLDVSEFTAEAGINVEPGVGAEPNVRRTTGHAALEGLHPMIAEACSELWANGHRREAIGKAALAVRDAVRDLSGLDDLDGHPLMAQAFSPKDPFIVVADLRTVRGRDLQQGAHLFAMGAMAAIRNVHAHNLEQPHVDEAWEQLAIFSYIARRLDEARNAPPEWRNESAHA
jgi:uncharacterized protein (TIGR02391 family)